MRIGIFFTANESWGGVYQYSLAMLEALRDIPEHTYVILTTSYESIPRAYRHDKRFTIVRLNDPSRTLLEKMMSLTLTVAGAILPKFIPFLYRHNLFWLITIPDKISSLGYLKAIERANVDLMVYPTSYNISFLSPVPAIVAIHDLNHKLNPQFPEVSAGGHWEIREYSFSHIAKYGKRIFVDSKVGKEDVLNCYPGTDPDKIVILPFLPPSYLDPKMSHKQAQTLLKKRHIPKNFFYYPAKFWPHKGHLHLIEALKICHAKGYPFGLVLTGAGGAEFDTLPEVMRRVKAYHLEKYVKYLGFVDDAAVVSALYKEAIAMTMPTHIGPTNIPVLEAWAMGTPVIYSNVRGCREQLGDAGIGLAPDDHEAIARAMIKMATNKTFRASCVQKGRRRLARWQPKNFVAKVRETITSLK